MKWARERHGLSDGQRKADVFQMAVREGNPSADVKASCFDKSSKHKHTYIHSTNQNIGPDYPLSHSQRHSVRAEEGNTQLNSGV